MESILPERSNAISTREQAILALKLCQEKRDIEAAHSDADNILCELLSSLGYHDVVSDYRRVKKWYA